MVHEGQCLGYVAQQVAISEEERRGFFAESRSNSVLSIGADSPGISYPSRGTPLPA